MPIANPLTPIPCQRDNTNLWAKNFGAKIRAKWFVPYKTYMQNCELFSLTYGALVVQLVKDYENYAQVNKQLEKMYVHMMSNIQGL